jgi:hypothetical protein
MPSWLKMGLGKKGMEIYLTDIQVNGSVNGIGV